MSGVSMHIRHYMFYQLQLGNNESAAARHICVALGKVLLPIAPLQVGLKDFVRVIRHWKIIRDLDVL